MTITPDESGNPQAESVLAGSAPAWPLPAPRIPAPPPPGGHPLRRVPADPQTLARVRAALQQL